MTLPTIIELWAASHKLLNHTPGDDLTNKRVFRVRNMGALPDFVRSLPQNVSPSIMIDLMHEINYFSEGKKNVSYTIYFCAKGGYGKADAELLAQKALETTEQLIEDFRRFIFKMQDENANEYASVDTNFSTIPYGPLLDGWYATACAIDKVELVSLC